MAKFVKLLIAVRQALDGIRTRDLHISKQLIALNVHYNVLSWT